MDNQPYRIAIVGSYDPERMEELNLHEPERAPEAGRELGQALARNGFHITVYASYDHLLELDVARGYLEVAEEDQAGCIVVHYSHSYPPPRFPGQAEGEDRRFDYKTDENDNWEVSFYRSIKDSDGMLLMGGGPSTLIAGIVAISHDKPVVACAYFGGEAKKVWDALSSSKLSTLEERQRMANGWTTNSAERMVGILQAQIERRKAEKAREKAAHEAAQRKAQRRQQWINITGFIALLAGFAILAISQNDLELINRNWLVLLPLTAGLWGITGAMLGNILENSEEVKSQKRRYSAAQTIILGFFAGLLTGVLFVLAQEFASPVVEETEQTLRFDRLLLFTMIIGIVAGLTFEAVYPRIKAMDIVHERGISAGTGSSA